METQKSTGLITVVPADLYDKITQDTPDEENAALQEASHRAKLLIVPSRT